MQNLYRHFDVEGVLLYVGVSLNTINRLGQHKNNAHWFGDIARVDIEQFETRKNALDAEKEAITKENPLHNLYRPKVKEQRESQKKFAEQSRRDLTKRIVQFNPIYTVQGAADVLGTSSKQVKEWCEAGKLSCVVIREQWDTRWNKMQLIRRITGWQLIDFLENFEAGNIVST